MIKKNQDSKKVAVIHGPNLNMLGKREPAIYGTKTLAEINQELISEGKNLCLEVDCFQSNAEGMIVDRLQKSFMDSIHGIIINPAAFTHTSIAIRDALAMLDIPKVEVHLSNIYAREAFRRESVISEVVTGTISGFGTFSYLMALWFLAERLKGNINCYIREEPQS